MAAGEGWIDNGRSSPGPRGRVCKVELERDSFKSPGGGGEGAGPGLKRTCKKQIENCPESEREEGERKVKS